MAREQIKEKGRLLAGLFLLSNRGTALSQALK